MAEMNIKSTVDDPPLWGAVAIAAELGVNTQRAHYMLHTGALAGAGAKLIAGRWCVSRAKLRAFIEAEARDE